MFRFRFVLLAALCLAWTAFAATGQPAEGQPATNRQAPRSEASSGVSAAGPRTSVAGRRLYQGDILTAKPQSITTAYTASLWPEVNGVATVYYVIDAASDPNATAKIQAAIATSNADFPNILQWVPWQASYGPNYVDINLSASNLSGQCEAAEGYEAIPAQPMTGSTNCAVGTILHEMGHVIGLWHEQSRGDRDSYVTLNYDNVIKGSWSNFEVLTDNQQILGLYDYASVMQYPAYSFSRNGGPVIETIPAGMPLANVDGVPVPASVDYSAGDKEAIERLYGAAPTQVTITSNPVGLTVEVDGTPVTTPQTFNWALNSTHTLDVASGVQTLTGDITGSTTSATFYYTYGRWNDSMAQSHTITVAPGNGGVPFPATSPQVATYSANFIQLVPYTSAVYPASTGTVAVSPQPQSYSGTTGSFFVARQQATLTATPASGWKFYEFNNGPFWLPGGLGANPKTFYVPDTGNPVDTTAEFSNAPIYTVDVSPDTFSSNLYAYVDGEFTYVPRNFSPYMYYDTTWTPGSSHTLNLDSPEYPYSVNSRYAFSSWSDGGAQSHSIASLPATGTSYVATLTPQFAPATNFNPAPCGGTASISPSSPTGDGFYPTGQVLTYTASPDYQNQWQFAGWTYDLTSDSSPASLTANDETLVYTNFNLTSTPLTVTSLSPASVAAGGPGFTLLVNGSGFLPNSYVEINGRLLFENEFTYSSPNGLLVPVQASDIASPGNFQVSVTNSPVSHNCSIIAAASFIVSGPSSVTLTSSANPSNVNTPVTFTAMVASSTTTPTGTVTFYNGSMVLGTVALNSSALATYTTSTLNPTFANITATYNGDSTHPASTSAVLTQTITNAPVYSFSPASLTFPATPMNTQSPSQVVTLTNTGAGNAPVNFSLSGEDPGEFIILQNTCPGTLAVGANCTVTVAFKPSALGAAMGTLIANTGYTPQESIPLSGTGGSAPTFTFSPASLTYPATNLGVTSAGQTVTITNSGPATATVSSYAFSGTNASEFSLSAKTCGTSLAGGASCTLTVVFKPTVAGAATANLVATDSAAGSPQTVPLSGTGSTQPMLAFSPTSLSFGTTIVGGTSTGQVLTIKNTSPYAMTVSSYKFSGTNASAFLIQSKTCVTTLAADSACTLTIQFKPTTTGSLTASLVATDNATGSPQSAALSGTGAAQPSVSFSPVSLSFPTTNLNASSAALGLTITNTSASPMTVNSYTFLGANAGEFSIQSKSCGSSLAANTSCTINVVFKPTVSGAAAASLVAADNAVGSPQMVGLSGTGGAQPTVSFSPASLSFPSTAIGTTSAAQTLTISNTSASAMTVNSYAFSGANASAFSIQSKSCGGTLAADASCTINVLFKPAATGAASANLVATDNAVGSPQIVPLSGTGK